MFGVWFVEVANWLLNIIFWLLGVMLNLLSILCLFSIGLLGVKYANAASLHEIDQLYEDLFYNYLKISRPVKNSSDVITIQFAAMLIRIIDVDEKSQVLMINLMLEMQWNDSRLVWNPNSYGGTRRINIPSDQIWTPDIVLYNNADGMPHITAATDAFVYSDGLVVWITPQIYKAFCQINVKFFPYDVQKCYLKFGGWSHDGFHLSLVPFVLGNQNFSDVDDETDGKPGRYLKNGMDLSYFQKSQEWDLLNLTSIRRERKYFGCCGPSFYIDITFWITLRRKALFYTVNLVIPCMLIAFLTTFVFYLTDHKITFVISVLVALSVFFLVLVDLIPANSEVIPLFGEYLLFTMFLVTVSIAVSVIVLNIHYRDSTSHDMPHWVRVVFLNYLPRLLRMKVPEWHKVDPKIEEIKKLIRKNLSYNQRFRGSFNRRPSPYFMSVNETEEENGLKDLALMKGMHPVVIRQMISNLSSIADHFATMEEESKGSDDWSYVAFVIDRVFLIIFTVVNIIGSIFIVVKAPILFDTREPLPVPQYPDRPLGGDILASKYY